MTLKQLALRGTPILALIVLAACVDSPIPSAPDAAGPFGQAAVATLPSQAQRAAWFAQASSEVLALPQTVYADDDEDSGQLVFGIENTGAGNQVRGVLARLGIPASAYRLEVTEPISFMATLRDEFRPTIGGIQIHFSSWLCTLGFNVTAGGQRSFITNSHCTDTRGVVEGTNYYQPLSSTNPNVIATEVADPAYSSNLAGCSLGKVCRRSDASRALYNGGTASTQGAIAKTTQVNKGSLTLASSNFAITSQSSATTFSGAVNKVGRTTGWTQGNVNQSCVNVNVSQTNIQLICQTLVFKRGTKLVGPGDSGSPVFKITSGNDVELIGILWGGSGSGDLFVFSPVANIVNELGNFDATGPSSGTGDGGNNDPPPPTCIERGNSGKCK